MFLSSPTLCTALSLSLIMTAMIITKVTSFHLFFSITSAFSGPVLQQGIHVQTTSLPVPPDSDFL